MLEYQGKETLEELVKLVELGRIDRGVAVAENQAPGVVIKVQNKVESVETE